MIIGLAEALDVSLFGGKAVQLGAAIREGLPVPAGYALSHTLTEDIAREDAAAFDALDVVSEELGLMAVRSSAVDEDSAAASFAGAHLSLLAVSGRDAVVAAVRAVHESGRQGGARVYRAALGLDVDGRMAVVLQRLVDADVAGVLFTRNPVTGADERVIEASWGLGEAVVSGLVTPDRYRVARGGALLERTLGDKDIAVRLRNGPGTVARTVEVPVGPDSVDVFCLGDAELEALDVLASHCDRVYDSPDHDIEFAFHQGQIFLLQRRAITSV